MIKSLKMFADCVESLRTAEKKYEEEPTPFIDILSPLKK